MTLRSCEDPYLEEIRQIISGSLEGYGARVYLFGSRASQNASTGSDCDVGIYTKQRLAPGILSSIREQLEESTIPYQVEIVDLSETSREFAAKVEQEGTLWHDSMRK
jgi:hypothetical protein